MTLYSQQSLDQLREKVNLIEVVSAHIPLQRSGASYKACCPFHEEKSPSFIINKADTHYHCFGCGAHGDAIAFLMMYMKMGFVEAIEYLAERFHVALQKVDGEEKQLGPSKAQMKLALEKACQYYHFFLLHTQEGHEALAYLYSRGISLAFIRKFQIGYALGISDALNKILLGEGITEEVAIAAGLRSITSTGRKKDFFQSRITFPIRDAMGAVIGFSARKFHEEVFGGKYINTPETSLFKKSQVLFGLSYSRHRIAKERIALIVEGQLDALRLIDAGFDYTVAGQGTAFGEGHVKELISLGVAKVLLCMDADNAGKEATVKIGELFLSKGVDVSVVEMPLGSDPDSFLRSSGKEAFASLILAACDYLKFTYRYLLGGSTPSPSKKNEVVESLSQKIKKWQHPVLVHESLKKLAYIANIPEDMLGVQGGASFSYIRRSGAISKVDFDPDRIMEVDLLRWLLMSQQSSGEIFALIFSNIDEHHFKVAACRSLFTAAKALLEKEGEITLVSFGSTITAEEEGVLHEIMQRKLTMQKNQQGVREAIIKLLQRKWMEEAESIKVKIQEADEAEVLLLVKAFDELKKNPPKVKY